MNDGDTLTVELTVREARALRHAGQIMATAFEEAGCLLTDVELLDGSVGVSPLLTSLMRLEVALVTAGVEV